jgi:hypothetical protein
MASRATPTESTGAGTRTVRVLQHDPELGRDLAPNDYATVASDLVAPLEVLVPGEWTVPWGTAEDYAGYLGVLVLDGLLMRVQQVGAVAAGELLGAGDVLRPWGGAEDESLTFAARWQVIQRTPVLLLDRRFAAAAGQWPELVAAIVERTVQRARLLAFQMGIRNVRRIDARLLLLLWRLADRWGRVTPEGVIVPLRLTHSALANLVGAQRPSVTTALGQLAQADRVSRRGDGSWLLKGRPPDLAEPLFEAATS